MLTGLWNLPDIQNSRHKRSKNKLVREDAMTQAQVSSRSGLWAPVWLLYMCDILLQEVTLCYCILVAH